MSHLYEVHPVPMACSSAGRHRRVLCTSSAQRAAHLYEEDEQHQRHVSHVDDRSEAADHAERGNGAHAQRAVAVTLALARSGHGTRASACGQFAHLRTTGGRATGRSNPRASHEQGHALLLGAGQPRLASGCIAAQHAWTGGWANVDRQQKAELVSKTPKELDMQLKGTEGMNTWFTSRTTLLGDACWKQSRIANQQRESR
jgi:hypothetical protein